MKRKTFPVVEARFLTKYKNPSLEYDNGRIFTIFEGNCELRHGRTGGWQLIGICIDKDVEDEPCCPFFAVTMMQEFQQSKGIKVNKPPSGSPDKRQCDPTEAKVEE